jgi:hypothetical protein
MKSGLNAAVLVASMLAACGSGLDLSVTPRADENLELLALRVSGAVVAPQDVYDRVVRDVTAIRAAHPEVQGVRYLPRDDGKSLLVIMNKSVADANRARFQELYARWRLVDSSNLSQLTPDSQIVALRFVGIYDMTVVAREFAALGGVSSAEPDRITNIGGADTICLTRDGVWYRYVFERASGCEACGGQLFGFSADVGGVVISEANWDPATPAPMPGFIRRFGPGVAASCATGS